MIYFIGTAPICEENPRITIPLMRNIIPNFEKMHNPRPCKKRTILG